MIAFAVLYKAKYIPDGGINNDYLDKAQTTAINGIFVLFVFLRHFSQYITYDEADAIFNYVDVRLGQLIVVTFLFYSGYGIRVSIQKKGIDYVRGFPLKRIFKVWYHFAIVVALFIVVNTIMHQNYDFVKNILAFSGWTSIGNSNWYIFTVLFLYISTYIAYSICAERPDKGVFLLILMCMGYYIVLRNVKGFFWYNTVFSYPMGMLYAQHELKLKSFVQKSKKHYWSLFVGFVMMTAILYYVETKAVHGKTILYWMLSCGFMAVILLLTMKLKLNNRALMLLGTYTFEIYILQRIPMIMLQEHIADKRVYFSACFIITLIMAVGLKKLTNKTDRVFRLN